MRSLQLPGCSRAAISSSFWGRDVCFVRGDGVSSKKDKVRFGKGKPVRVSAMSSNSFKMNLNEYMVTLDKPLGIRFALSADGKIFVHALKKGVFLVILCDNMLFVSFF